VLDFCHHAELGGVKNSHAAGSGSAECEMLDVFACMSFMLYDQ